MQTSVDVGEFDRHRGVGQQKTENKNKQKLRRNFGECAEMRVRTPVPVEKN